MPGFVSTVSGLGCLDRAKLGDLDNWGRITVEVDRDHKLF